MRELTLAQASVAHPQMLPDGSVVWMDAGIREKLQQGDPVLGWEGDPRLEVYLGPDGRLYVWRLEANGEYGIVTRSKPGTPLDDNLIRHLVAHDVRRGYDPRAEMDAHNTARERSRAAEVSERMGPQIDRLHWALKRDDRTGAGL